jgi:hypothetical protein
MFSVSPATPFSDLSLPNHTKMFELVHVVTSMDDFVFYRCLLSITCVGVAWPPPRNQLSAGELAEA